MSISTEIDLQRFMITLSGSDFPEKEVLAIAGGRDPEVRWFQKMAEKRLLWAVDSGADLCRTVSVLPDFCLGDFDGIDPVTLDWLKKNESPLQVYDRDKDKTDMQLCLEKALDHVPPVLMVITGCFGGRLDHTLSLVNSVFGANQKGAFARIMADHSETLIFLKGGETLSIEGDLPPIVSLLSFTEKSDGVCINGTRWELEGETLYRNCPYSISNRPEEKSGSVSVKLRKGWSGVYLAWDEAELKGHREKGSGP